MRPTHVVVAGLALTAVFLRWRGRHRADRFGRAHAVNAEPLPATVSSKPEALPSLGELFSAERLEQHARELAAGHRVGRTPTSLGSIRRKVDESEEILAQARARMAHVAPDAGILTPVAAWLVDNAYLVTQQIREVRQDLPDEYYAQLPKLVSGPLRGYPRVYAVALELIAHTDGLLSSEQLVRFILAYESVTPLTMGELWATAIMLRVGLVENLAHLASLTLETHRARTEADRWANRILDGNGSRAEVPDAVLSTLLRAHSRLPAPLAVRLLWRLHGDVARPALAPIAERLEHVLVEQYGGIEEVYHAESQQQATIRTSIGNTIASLRAISVIDWAEWFEQVSRVERALREDPGGWYARCTFATRDHYRHRVEELARRSGLAEEEIARRLVVRAGQMRAGDATRLDALGDLLVGPGRLEFEREVGYAPSPREAFRRQLTGHPTATYLMTFAGCTATLVAVGLVVAGHRRPSRITMIAAALLVTPASELALGILNWSLSRALPPRFLPRLDLSAGIPIDLRTMVVIPTLLLTEASVRGQLERLEVLSLAHADRKLHFAVLSDFADAPAPEMPEDAALLDVAVRGIEDLNRRAAGDRFFLFHRRRVWSAGQSCFMGWERKRGKLVEFNRLLVEDLARDDVAGAGFDVRIGDQAILPQIRFVITLDSDTQLPRDAARAMIGTLAHPLNAAVIDLDSRRVVAGYGILQPRVATALPSAYRSRFARLFAGSVGLDAYTTAVSNAQMDLFGEGTYAGKGIYDPDVLHAVLRDQFPDNTLLSHDLLEGNYARVGFLSDVELIDSYPTTYAAYIARHHRWIRGDWQIARWLLPRVPTGHGDAANALPVFERFKIFDNLRRSLIAPASLGLLATALLSRPGHRAIWVGYALLPVATPLVLGVLDRTWAVARSESASTAWRGAVAALRQDALRASINLAFLADHAWTNADAIIRALHRTIVTRRDLLAWETAEQAEGRLGHTRRRRRTSRSTASTRLVRHQIPAAAILLALAGTGRSRREKMAAVAPIVVAWIASPLVAAWLDHPPVPAVSAIRPQDRAFLRRLARTYWHYFETFVTAERNALAPDNFQEDPSPVVADRTSPTNLGLQLLADLAARDFGYIGLLELTSRTERTFATMQRLERYRGHLLNWYDTRSLVALPPAYVSTVDSGNLAGCLLALNQGYRELRGRPIVGPEVGEALADALALVRAETFAAEERLARELAALETTIGGSATTLANYRNLLRDVETRASTWSATYPASTWLPRLRMQARSWLDDLDALAPAGGGLDAVPPPTLLDLATLPDGSASPPEATRAAIDLLARHDAIVAAADELVRGMDFRFLYDPQRHLFTIGYNLAAGRCDASDYDLLASESRLASYLAIAKSDVPTEHWFHLGRPLAPVQSGLALVSWGGTMFEYLMPLLVMRRFPETLLDHTYRAVVERQIAYGRERQVPWGVSEAAYAVRDASHVYQYRSFGVPGLGLRSGLADDLVVAPYATALALPVRPDAATANLRALAREGLAGRYGLYESVDFTRSRLPPGVTRETIRCFMAHHQGMSLLALDNALNNQIMPRRFHQDPLAQSAELLLQERIPRDLSPSPLSTPSRSSSEPAGLGPTTREFLTANTPLPRSHVLSNGTYTVLVTNAGSGGSFCGDLAVTRWREDVTRDCWGSFIYLRDVRSDATWSAAYQPVRYPSNGYHVAFSLEKAEFNQRVAGIDTRLEISVSTEDNVEVRRITLANRSAEPREIELTSYAEVVLGPAREDDAHPAFSNLFVETEFVEGRDALLASRRPRSPSQARDWAFHTVDVRGHAVGAIQYETDRAAFIGRGRTLVNPRALHGSLGNTVGAVLDPIVSLRRHLRLVPGGMAQVNFATGVAESRDAALHLADKYRSAEAGARVFEMARAHGQAELHGLGLSGDQARQFQQLAGAALYADPRLRAAGTTLRQNLRGQADLWRYGISGDFPIVLLRISGGDQLDLVQEILRAHQFWRLKHLAIDLVVLVDEATAYRQLVRDGVLDLVRGGSSAAWFNQPGGVFVLTADAMPPEDRILLQTVARVQLDGWRGSLDLQLPSEHDGQSVVSSYDGPMGLLPRPRSTEPTTAADPGASTELGRFSPDGQEFVLELRPDVKTPSPWVNVIANERFGFTVSESGSGFTWAENSQQNRLTPWSNDPVVDPVSEAIYLRDAASGEVWSPLPQPAPRGRFRVRHGFGYSVFAQEDAEIQTEVTVFVPESDPVKVYRTLLHNRSDRARRLSATFYVEWVLGTLREKMAPFVVTSFDETGHALLAQNAYNAEYGRRIAFVAASLPIGSASGDRADFIGRNGDLLHPAALDRPILGDRFGAGLDPCGAVRCDVDLAPSTEAEVVFLLGQGESLEEVRSLVDRYRGPAASARALDQVTRKWKERLTRVQVRTPNPTMDVLLNGWLLYQTLSCRLWARSAFYQSGGAYGFRDQLQDVMALTHAAPELTRAHILRAAGRQFTEGDVQHWWHPASGRGVRTHCSDDYLWLPFVTHHYVRATGDTAVLDEVVPYLSGRLVGPDESEYYDQPTIADRPAPLYEHCAAAIDRALTRFGTHGLPLMGSGDWNDGMNLVGHQGKGESVWVGWFLHANLVQMADIAGRRGDTERASRYRAEARRLQGAIEEHAWDGAWYRRAYFDDGTPLGSAINEECRIDSIAQSWSVISGAAPGGRRRQAMAAVGLHLIDESAGLIKLLAPPFDRSPLEPGYIKGYLPGVRENGGQYTHAGIWVIWAHALLGDGQRAHELFSMINPVRLASLDPGGYLDEPYVIAADVYSAPGHVGRGGWTWYTGSAGWMYRLGLETLLGLRREGNDLIIAPCIPPSWPAFAMTYRHGDTTYEITVDNSRVSASKPATLTVDGAAVAEGRVGLVEDGGVHVVHVVLSSPAERDNPS